MQVDCLKGATTKRYKISSSVYTKWNNITIKDYTYMGNGEAIYHKKKIQARCTLLEQDAL